jgi:hypothetical protein
MIRAFVITFVFILTGLQAAEISCPPLLVEIAKRGVVDADTTLQLLKTIDAEKINWNEIVTYIDPGQVNKEKSSFPKREVLLKTFGVTTETSEGVEMVEKLLTGLGYAFKDAENFSKVTPETVPDLFKRIGNVELIKDQSLTRLEALSAFITYRLLYLSDNPPRAVRIAMMDAEKDFGQNLTSGIQRRMELVSEGIHRLWLNKSFIGSPILALKIMAASLKYRFRRHLVNSNFLNPALAQEAFEKLTFVLEKAPLRQKEQLSIEELPANFQAEVLTEFGDEKLSEQLGSNAPGPMAITRADLGANVFKRMAQGKAKKDPKEILEDSVKLFRETYDQYQEWLRELLLVELESAYQDLQAALLEKSQVGVKRRVALAQSAPPFYRWPIDFAVIHSSLATSANQRLVKSAQAYVKIYLPVLAISSPLHRVVLKKYIEVYEKNPIVRYEGEVTLARAEKIARKGNLTERTVMHEAALKNFASSPIAWASVNNPSALTAQFVQQFLTAGLFQNPTVGRSTAMISSFVVIGLMIAWPYIMRPSEDSKLEKMFGDRSTLLDTNKFISAKWEYTDRVRIHGISSADKFVLDSFFREEDNHLMEKAWNERFQFLKSHRTYGAVAALFAGQFPATARVIREGSDFIFHTHSTEKDWPQLRLELDEIMNLMQQKRLKEMAEIQAYEKKLAEEIAKKNHP